MSKLFELIFSVEHAESLATAKKVDELKQYIKSFFFYCGLDIYFDNGDAFQCLDIDQAKRLLPRDLVIFDKERVIFDAREYLESCDFMKIKYEVKNDSSRQKTYKSKIVVNGVNVMRHYLNLHKSNRVEKEQEQEQDVLIEEVEEIVKKRKPRQCLFKDIKVEDKPKKSTKKSKKETKKDEAKEITTKNDDSELGIIGDGIDMSAIRSYFKYNQ